jgi:hypothetical protein
MRIISPPVKELPVHPVEAPQGIRSRVSRDPTPDAGYKASDSAGNGSGARRVSAITVSGAALSVRHSATVGTGLSAQKVFHALNGSPAEVSLPEVNRAYTKTDSLRFKDVPFTMRVV